jgi:galactose-1-phosphate uridylyltransferase
MKKLSELVEELPPELQQEVRDFVEFLLEKRGYKKKIKNKDLKLRWKGALKDLKEDYTSVELQHKVLDWWGD